MAFACNFIPELGSRVVMANSQRSRSGMHMHEIEIEGDVRRHEEDFGEGAAPIG
jgi:hypothetical protein